MFAYILLNSELSSNATNSTQRGFLKFKLPSGWILWSLWYQNWEFPIGLFGGLGCQTLGFGNFLNVILTGFFFAWIIEVSPLAILSKISSVIGPISEPEIIHVATILTNQYRFSFFNSWRTRASICSMHFLCCTDLFSRLLHSMKTSFSNPLTTKSGVFLNFLQLAEYQVFAAYKLKKHALRVKSCALDGR